MKNKLFDLYKTTDTGNIDFFYKLEVGSDADLETIRISPDDRVDTLALDIYGTENNYWIIPFVNNFQDIFFDMPLTVKEIEGKTLAILEQEAIDSGLTIDSIDWNKYNTLKEELVISNEEKTKLKMVSTDKINRLLLQIDKFS